MRLLGVAGPLALVGATILLGSPLSVAFYQEPWFGFHIEDLTPVLCLILFYFLLRRQMLGSVTTALAVISVKEDAPIAAALVAIIAWVETWLSSAGEHPRQRVNWPALVTLIISIFAVPLSQAISWSQPATEYALHSVDRMWISHPGTLRGPGALFLFICTNLVHWLDSSVVRQWLWVTVVGSFGMIFLRPYYLIPGVATTLVAWLMQRNDLLWPPRFHLTEAFLSCLTLVGFASLLRASELGASWVHKGILTATITIVVVSTSAQLAFLPKVRDAYLLRSKSPYSSRERQQADALFVRYRREGKPEEPVIASPPLFRYAHDRNLFWLDRLVGRPAPVWILSDGTENYGYRTVRMKGSALVDRRGRSMLDTNDYEVVARQGRFVLLRKR